MFQKARLVVVGLGLLGAIGTLANQSEAGQCSGTGAWKFLYTCSSHGTIDTRDSCSPAFPGGSPICVPRLRVNKNSGLITKGDGLDVNGNIIQGCRGQDTVADGVPVVRGAECSQAKAVKYFVSF